MGKIFNKVLLPTSIFFCICFVIMLLGVQKSASWIIHLDTYFISLIQMNINPFNTELFNIITFFGSATMIGIVGSGFLFFIFIKKQYKLLLLIACSIFAGAAVVPQLIKRIIERDRPVHGLIQETGFSFPSGHATSVSFLYSLITIMICLFLFQSIRYKTIILVAAFLLIMMIMVSRVYLGVHYPSDVIAGFFLGLCLSTISIYILRKKNYM